MSEVSDIRASIQRHLTSLKLIADGADTIDQIGNPKRKCSVLSQQPQQPAASAFNQRDVRDAGTRGSSLTCCVEKLRPWPFYGAVTSLFWLLVQ